jgi:hypothetical protein
MGGFWGAVSSGGKNRQPSGFATASMGAAASADDEHPVRADPAKICGQRRFNRAPDQTQP